MRNVPSFYKRKKPVCQYSKGGEFIKEWPSMTEAAIGINRTPAEIFNTVAGRQKTCGGFVWKPKELGKVKKSKKQRIVPKDEDFKKFLELNEQPAQNHG